MRKRILIVDDSPIIHKLLRRTLESNGFEICGDATNGAEAVELYESLSPDIIFMDITMPVLDGLGATLKIIEKDVKAKIIMLTAMADEEIVGQAQAAGVEIFLKKPFDEYKIISAISKVI